MRCFEDYAKFYEAVNADRDYRDEIFKIHSMTGYPTTILDIGCGTASYWKYFPKWTRIRGVEKSPSMWVESGKQDKIMCADILDVKKLRWEKNIVGKFQAAYALFDVANYIKDFSWFSKLNLMKGGVLLIEMWDFNKIKSEGFKDTAKQCGAMTRHIKPIKLTKKYVDLLLVIVDSLGSPMVEEIHRMYIHTDQDLIKACYKYGYKLVEVIRDSMSWKSYYKMEKK